MNRRMWLAAAPTAVVMMASGTIWACSALGPNTHVGVLLGVDQTARTFSILDAETNQPVTLRADDTLMSIVENAEGQIVVDYEETESSELRATRIGN